MTPLLFCHPAEGLTAAVKLHLDVFNRAGLNRPLKNVALGTLCNKRFVTGHDFSRADKQFIFLPSRL
jgi:hypothetical protein